MPIWYPVPSALDFLVGFLDVGHHLASEDASLNTKLDFKSASLDYKKGNSGFLGFQLLFLDLAAGSDLKYWNPRSLVLILVGKLTPASLWNLRNLKMIFLWTMFFGSDFDVQNFVRILEGNCSNLEITES
ncbi:unnamed protein product [Rhizophagus irregularis]|nr:unnamed protein product [Rhizophagus irregularis]